MKKSLRLLSIILCIACALCMLPVTVKADNGLEVKQVGVLDQSPQFHFVDFGETLLWQATFSEVIFENDELPADAGKRAIYQQGLFGDYIVINGKTVNQWNTQEYNCVTIHIGESASLGVYLEFNTKKMDGLISADTENYVTFLKGFTGTSGKALEENVTFYLAAGAATPFEIVDSSRAELPEIVDESELPFEITEVGILDQNPKKAIHDFGSTFLWQIDFTKDFYDVSQLDASGRKNFIQSEVGDYIIINGKSVTDWNNELFNSVMVNVLTNGTFGQYLEMNTSAIMDGLVYEDTESTVTILAGFPDGGENSLKESVSYYKAADSKELWVKLDEVVDTEEETESEVESETEGVEILEDETENTEIEDKNEENNGVWIVVGVVIAVIVAAAIVFVVLKGKKKQ